MMNKNQYFFNRIFPALTAAVLFCMVATPLFPARAAKPTGTFDLATGVWLDGTLAGTSAAALDAHNCWLDSGTFLRVMDGADIVVTGTGKPGGNGPLRIIAQGTVGITLENVTILADANYQTPLLLEPGANATLTLAGGNILAAGFEKAGIQVGSKNGGAALTIAVTFGSFHTTCATSSSPVSRLMQTGNPFSTGIPIFPKFTIISSLEKPASPTKTGIPTPKLRASVF